MRRLLWPIVLAGAFVSAGLSAGCASEEQPLALTPGMPCDPAGENLCNGGFCLALDSATGICTIACVDDAGCQAAAGAAFTCQVDATFDALVCKPGFKCSADASCPSGHRCDVTNGTCYIPVERGLCSPCTADPQCPDEGLCLRARGSGERFCTSPCAADESCPSGYLCREVAQDGVSYDGSEHPKQCVPRSESCNAGKPICSPCRGDDECGDGNDSCVENILSGEKFCGRSCNPACAYDAGQDRFVNEETGEECRSACPDNFSCTSLSGGEAGPFQCVPNSGTCGAYCDGGSEAMDLLQCGFGRSCDLANHECAAASDGRQCAPCTDDDSCNPPGSTGGSSCIVNQESGETFCAIPCSDDVDCDGSLGIGFSCLEVEGLGRCIPDRSTCTSGVGRLGDDCTTNGPADCLTGVCLQFGSVGLCSGMCGADSDCADGRYRCCALIASGTGEVYDCDAPLTGGGVCAPAGGSFGDDCEPGRPPCQDGHCLDIGTARLCSSGCTADTDCDAASGSPGQFACRKAQAVDETGAPTEDVDVCFPAGGGEPGSDCSFGPAACADRLCIKKDSGNVCTMECSGGGCPEGWTCDAADTVDGQSLTICLPPSAQGGSSE